MCVKFSLVELIVKHILHTQCSNSRILEDLTNIVILGPTITLRYRENVDRGAFSICPFNLRGRDLKSLHLFYLLFSLLNGNKNV